jgi:hypothetical protein
MSSGARRPFDNLFGAPDGTVALSDADWRRIQRRAERLAQRGEQPPGIAGVRDRARQQSELATEIGDALRARNVVLAQALIREGAAVFGHDAMLAAVEAQASADHMEAMEAVRRREADPGDQAGAYYESDYRTPYDESEDF